MSIRKREQTLDPKAPLLGMVVVVGALICFILLLFLIATITRLIIG